MAEVTRWHGWTRRSETATLCIGPLPERTRIALYVEEGVQIRPLAYFTSEEQAAEAMAIIDRMTGTETQP